MTPDEHANEQPLDMKPPEQDPVQTPAERRRGLTVVGIGGSAGGLAALQSFFGALGAPAADDGGMAFVVVTHMDPERESLLPEILQKHTPMPVEQVRDLIAIEPDNVYVIPPGRRIVVTDKHLDVEEFDEPRGRRTPIDHFFRTLADVHQESVAIILSGGGTDGAVGVKAIKEQGGLLMVQDPDEAEHDSMPRAAISTGLADVVLPAADLARRLVEYHTGGVRLRQDAEALTAGELETLYRILTQVQVHTGHDFSQYKRSTILRRILRRMQLNGLHTLEAYLTQVRHDAAEAHALFNDLLIGVTNFFRDRESWEGLAETVIPRLFEGKGQGDTVRVWSIGCATGEEAYSLAILLLEHVDTLEKPAAVRPGLQVFATDLDDGALSKAREGIYPEAIEADVSPERLERFFVKEGHYYRIKRELRDMVLFSSHSVLRDPPFSRLDLISCRNLLIYLNRDLQENVFEIFHYALNPESYLFLGSSESAESVHHLFRTLDKQYRIFRARPWRGDHRHVPTLPLAIRRPREPGRFARPDPRGQGRQDVAGLHQNMLEQAAPPSVLIDEQHQVLHLSGHAGRYLLHPLGVPTTDLLKIVRPELQFELRTALFQAFHAKQPVLTRAVLVQFNGTPRRVVAAVHPRAVEGDAERPADETGRRGAAEQLALVFFLEDAESDAPPDHGVDLAGVPSDAETAREELVDQLQSELARLRERLQATTEEYESSNEELKAANEELQSINEEYRSTTEELETSKEELQSVNEELQTVNAELKNKLEEVSRAHGDLENLMAATDIATLFLDRDLRIRRYTPSTVELFSIMPGDRGRPLSHLTNKLEYADLVADAAQVLKTLVPVEREVQDVEGRWLMVRVRPYRTLDDRIDGVVLTFVDIDELKQTEAAVRIEKEYADKIGDTVREGLLVLKPDLRVEFANESFFEMFRVDGKGTEGRLIYDLGNGQWDIPELRRLLEEILPEVTIFNDYRVDHEFEDVGRRIMLLNARRLDHVERILLAVEDITEREQYEHELRQSEARYRGLVTASSEVVYRMSADWQEMRRLEGRGFLADLDAPSDRWLEVYIPSDEQPRVLAAVEEAIRSSSNFELEHRVRRADGTIGWIFSRAVPLLDDDGEITGWFGAASDISERKRAEEALAKAHQAAAESEERKSFLLQLSDDLRHQADALAIQDVVTRMAMDYFNADRAYYCEIDGDLVTIRRDAARQDLPSVAGSYTLDQMPIFKGMSAAGRPIVVSDVGSSDVMDDGLKQLTVEMKILSYINVPVLKQGELVGMFCITQTTPRRWTEAEVELSEETAQRAWAAVERSRTEAALREREQQLVALNETLEERVRARTQEVRDLAAQLTMAEHEERGRVAQVLHDDLQQRLYSLQIQLTLLNDANRDDGGKIAADELRQMEEVLQETIELARRLSVELSPPVLEGEGLAEAVEWLASQMRQQYLLEVTVETDGAMPVPELDRRVLLYQMIRELLFNVVKHTGVASATVRLQRADDAVLGEAYRIDVVDHGPGFDVEAALAVENNAHSRGLRHARERLRLIGGRLEIESVPGEGARVTIVAPSGL